ncbi:radical SAM/SPASM domain-containing protein [Methanoplanus limicola]|uniref:Radical SAM domain protein n=1 Tax=Methanoplanus limicola DSM 2279 TaxID=937775 RepID=H1Z409_9EURY|nr:radical SAM protein [Methanoplanus limicola]EHQ35688.1 Radical SAM domain protein [Methanoplanus limicola DSM 2279]
MNAGYNPPRLISWNITLRCPLKCAHCYVDAGNMDPDDILSTNEAKAVIDGIKETGDPVLILSGGEPLLREDIFDIVEYGNECGLTMAIGTSGFLLDKKIAVKLKNCGLKAAAISIDSVNPEVHDEFRGVRGAWDKAVAAVGHCHDAGIRVKINMTVMQPEIEYIEDVIDMGTSMDVSDYHLFFPVHTGRGGKMGLQNPDDYESLIQKVLFRYRDGDISVRPTCAPQFRRIADESGLKDKGWGRGCIAGISYCRIFATGEVTPCPYLPVSAGSLRETSFKDIWEHSVLFNSLRDQSQLKGKCGQCGYKTVCGGCRARAYARMQNPGAGWCDGLKMPDYDDTEILGEDPWCPYEPDGVIL